MRWYTIEMMDRLEELTGLSVRNLFAASQPVIEDLIVRAGVGAENSSEPEEADAFREIEQWALEVWHYRFNFSGSQQFNS